MRYAIVSDIHANLQAWQAVIADLASLPQLAVDQIICLGDVVGYGPDPSTVLKEVRQHASATVIGNHDAAACGRMDTSLFNDNAREVIDWTSAHLSHDDLHYLKRLPRKVRPDGAGFLAVHAEVVDPMNFGYILTEEDAKANFAVCDDKIIFIGHTHRAGAFIREPSGEIGIHYPLDFQCESDKRYIINPGSVGDPRNTEIVASYVIYDAANGDVYFRRIPFDVSTYRATIDATSLVTRPYFIRYLDDNFRGPASQPLATPPATNIDLAAPPVKVKKKNPFVKLGVGVLLMALAAATWFFTTISNTSEPDFAADSGDLAEQKESNDEAEPAVADSDSIPDEKAKVSRTLPVTARYVRVVQPRKGGIALAEVEVFSGRKNVARGGRATQSTTKARSYSAAKAIDGKKTAELKKGHMSLTKEEPSSWWMVDLGKEYPVHHVVLWNRNDGRNPKIRKAIRSRLDKFTLEMLDADKKPVFRKRNNPGGAARIVIK